MTQRIGFKNEPEKIPLTDIEVPFSIERVFENLQKNAIGLYIPTVSDTPRPATRPHNLNPSPTRKHRYSKSLDPHQF